MEFGLSDIIIKKIQKVLATNPKVDKAYIFGSRAKGNYREASDIDIAIKGTGLNYDDVLQLSVKLEELELPYKIDLLDFYAIKEALLKEHIERVGIEFYSSWKECKLGELCIKIGSGATPTGGSSAYQSQGISLIRSQNVLDFKFSYNGLVFLNDKQASALKNVIVKEDDILLNITGDSVARICKVPKNILPARVNQHVAILRPNTEILDNTFLLYQLQAKKENLLILSEIGGTRNALTKTMIEDFKIKFPPLPEQTAIASILCSLDDKIDLLHRQNKTLEQLAETLFRQWFVEEADESWEEKSLTEIADYLNGLALQKFPSNGIDSLPVIKIREMKQGISDNTDQCSKEIPLQYIINDGDVLFSWSGSLEVVLWTGGEGALNQHLFRVTSKKYPKWFYYLATKYHLEDFKTIAESKSTTMGHIQREHLTQAIILIPPKDLFDQYDQQLAPLLNKRIDNNNQIQTLTKLRDILLPKLMSGEVRVIG